MSTFDKHSWDSIFSIILIFTTLTLHHLFLIHNYKKLFKFGIIEVEINKDNLKIYLFYICKKLTSNFYPVAKNFQEKVC